MANTLLPVHAQDITDTALISLKNQCVLLRFVDRQYDKLWGQTGAKRGTTINLRYPVQYALRRGNTAQPQASQETYFPVTLGEPIGVDMDFTSQELLLTIDDFQGRFVKKATLPIANGVDTDIANLYKKVPNYVGTAGTPATSIETFLSATTKLADAGAPVNGDEWSMVIDYLSNQKIVNALAGQYNPSGKISQQWDSGLMTSAVGYKWSQDQNIKIHTVGTLGSTPLVNGVGQGANGSIIIDGTGGTVANYLREGDSIQFADVKEIKPNSVDLDGNYETTGNLKNFVVSANVDATSGDATITFTPRMVVSGPFRNVTGLPADNAAVTTFGHASDYAGLSTRQNLAFNKGAFVVGMVDLPLPGGMDMSARTTDEDTKISVRFLRGFDIWENVYISRLDMLHVAACPRPELACRVIG